LIEIPAATLIGTVTEVAFAEEGDSTVDATTGAMFSWVSAGGRGLSDCPTAHLLDRQTRKWLSHGPVGYWNHIRKSKGPKEDERIVIFRKTRVHVSHISWLCSIHRMASRSERSGTKMRLLVWNFWPDKLLKLAVSTTFFVLAMPLVAQVVETGVLTGTITDSSSAKVANATVTATSSESGQMRTATTTANGWYRFDQLPPGSYLLKVDAPGFKTLQSLPAIVEVNKTTVLDESLGSKEPVGEPTTTPPENLSNAPSSTAPSLSDLGLTPEQTQGNAKEQALLDKRTHMLKIHQRMGLITTIPLIATVILGPGAGGKSEGTANRDAHVALGALTGDLYGITAGYAIRAPRIKSTAKRGPIRFHEAMAWIHGPGMILTPIFGALAFEQKNNGEKVHGIARAHGPVAIVTAGAFGAALLSVSVKF